MRLPADYRLFLSLLGNGGAGPYYGLDPLDTYGRDLSRPFPFVGASDTLPAGEAEQLPDRDEYPGVLEFCHHGCAGYSYLVVNGPAYGTVWNGREEFYPTGLRFGVWYRRWLESALRILHNEHLIPLLQIGMTRAEVLATVGVDWKARSASGTPIRYFESPDIAAQLELDENDVVVTIRVWSSIVARPD